MEPQRDNPREQQPQSGSTSGARRRGQPGWLVWVLAACLVVAVVAASYLWIEKMRADDTLIGVRNTELAKWERAVRDNPDDMRSRLALAYAYRQVGRYEDSIAQCDIVLDSEPKNVSAFYNRGVSRLELGKGRAAEADLWNVLELEPNHVQASVALGEYYAGRGQYRSLLVAVRPAVDVHPEVAMLQYLTGLGYEHTGHPDWAIARYRLALDTDPNMTEAREGLVRLEADL